MSSYSKRTVCLLCSLFYNQRIFTKHKQNFRCRYRQESVLQLNLSGLKEDLAKADQSLRSMAGKPILNGRDSVRKVLDTFR